MISREQILETGAESVYEVVYSLKYHWLLGSGRDRGKPPLVFKDQTRLGGIEMLKGMSTEGILAIEWLDVMEASLVVAGGDGSVNGVIVVWTRRK